MNVLRGPGHDPGRADREREQAVQDRVEQMLSSPEALEEGIARSEAGEYAGPDADARFARFLREQPDERLAALGRALERGERPSDLLASQEFAPVLADGARVLRETDGHDWVRTIAEHDRTMRRD